MNAPTGHAQFPTGSETPNPTVAHDLEAVQYREFGPWHAVMPRDDGTPSDTTLCGRSAIAATRMYQSWAQLEGAGVCRPCFNRAGRIIQ